MRFYLTYKNHGLYDPVVDDTEVIYIPVDPEELEAVNIQTNINEPQQKTEVIDFIQTGRPPILVQPVKEFLADPDIEDLPLLINVDEIPVEGKFRLPVSENYDPEGNRVRLDKRLGKAVVTFSINNIVDKANEERIRLQQAQDAVSEYITESKINENQKINETLYEIDEVTDGNVRDNTLEVVTESLDKAISIAQEINENVNTELKTSKNREYFEENLRSENVRKESVKSIESDVNVLDEIKKFEIIDSQTTESNVEERKQLMKQDIDETIQSGTVNRTLEMFNKENTETSKSYGMEVNKEHVSINTKSDESNHRDSSAKQRAFSIGLQTIPHIRENINSVQCDYRVNLLTTFFLQLTNIMVTLTRFIATEPKTRLVQDSYSQKQENRGLEKKYKNTKLDKSNEQTFKSFEENEEGHGLSKYKYEHISHDSEEDLIRKGKLSGAKIAQIEGRKTTELTDKMDIVISEFQKKTGYEEQSHDQFCGSRSKMKSEKNTYHGESHKQSHSDHRKTYEEFSETKTQSFDIREMKSENQSFQSKTMKTEAKPYSYETPATDGKNLVYVAIVESHVYTNKDAIFEEQMRREREVKSENIEKTKLDTNQDIRKLSLADSTIIPPTKEISLNEIEDKVIKVEKSVTGIEQSSIKIAAKKISEVLEPLVELISDRSYSMKQAHTIEEPLKAVVQSTDVSTQEFEQHFVAKTVLSEKIYPSFEKPTKSVVEITEITADRNESQDLDVLKLIVAKPKCIIESDFKATAETLTILPEESKSDFVEETKIKEESAKVLIDEKMSSEVFEVSLIEQREQSLNEEIIKIEKPTLSLEESAFRVAQKSSISPIEAKSDIEIFEKAEQSAIIKFDELKAVESTIINLGEPLGNNICENPEMIPKYPISSMEDAHLITAEIFTILPEEPKGEHLEVSKITECKSSIDMVEIKAAETIVTLPEEPKYEHLEVLRIEEKIPETKIEEPSLKVAEIISMLPEEPKEQFYLPPLENQKAGITLIEFKAAEATIVETEESKQPELNIEQPKKTKSKQIIEPSSLHVAEVFSTTTAESSKLIPEMEKIQKQLAHIGIEEHKAIETTEVALGDLTYSKLTTLAPNTKQLKTSVEESVQSVAQITEVHLTEAESKMAISSKVITQAKATSAIEAIKTTKTVKSEEVGRSISPTSPSSPITPDVEEYVFSLEAELEHPYVVEEAVSGEASLRIKTQKKEIQSADTSYTLAIESIVEAQSETVEETEEIENIHLSKEVLKSIYEGYDSNKSNMSANIDIKLLEANKVMSTEAHSLERHHKLSDKKQTTMQDAIDISSKETNQNVSTAVVNLGNYEVSLDKAAVDQKSMSSQSSLHKNRKVKSSESQNSSLQKIDTSVKCMQSKSLESGIKSESSQYTEASNKQLSISASKSTESTLMETNIGLKINLHLPSGHEEAVSKSVKFNSFAAIESASQVSTQIVKDESNAFLKDEKLTLRTDLKDTRSNDGTISSTPTVPATPLTDEYIFRLKTELPEESIFIPRDCSITPESMHEDVVVNGLFTNYKTKIEERILYSPPLPTPPTSSEKTKPVYTKPGLKGGSDRQKLTKEEIHDSTLVLAIDRTLKQIEEYKASVGLTTEEMSYHKEDVDKEFIPINIVEEWLDNEADHDKAHSPIEEVDAIKITVVTEANKAGETAVIVTTESNMDDNDLEIQEISSNFDAIPLETKHDEMLNDKMYSEDKVDDFKTSQINPDENLEVEENEYEFVAVHPSNLNKSADNGSVTTNQFKSKSLNVNTQEAQTLSMDMSHELVMQHDQEIIGEEPIIPPVDSLKNSEVIKLLNEERTAVEERKWTTFLQKKYTPPPKTEVVYYGDFDIKAQFIPDAYKVKIVKQPKPKIAPDWKTEELKKESSPIIEISEPQTTEETQLEENNINEQDNNIIDQEYTLADQEDQLYEQENNIIEQENNINEQENNIIEQENNIIEQEDKSETESLIDPIGFQPVEKLKDKESEELELQEMAQRNLAEDLIKNVENMIDINAPTEQQLEQMRDQLAALAQLPSVIQQTVELVNKRINLISQKEQQKKKEEEEYKRKEEEHRRQEEEHRKQDEEERAELERANQTLEMRVRKTEEAIAIIKNEEIKKLLEAKMKQEKRQKKENMERMKIDQESRRVTQRSTPRMGHPMPLFGQLQERPVVLPGGRKWRTPEDVYDEEFINESLVGQAEVIKGTAMGVNFRKFEKPPPALDHLKHSEVYKAIHEVEQPVKTVELLGAVLAEADYIERARSMSPCVEKVAETTRKNP